MLNTIKKLGKRCRAFFVGEKRTGSITIVPFTEAAILEFGLNVPCGRYTIPVRAYRRISHLKSRAQQRNWKKWKRRK